MATKAMSKVVSNKEATSSAPKATASKAVAKEHKFGDHDTIRCVSCTVGGLLVEGPRSKILYRWTNLGDEAGIEYYDLIALLHSRSPYVFKPRFIIQDEEFLKQNPQLNKLYESLYTIEDFRNVLKMPPADMIEVLKKLPIGAQDAIKGIAAGMVDSGQMDSINTIKALDSFFGTNMLLKLAQNV